MVTGVRAPDRRILVEVETMTGMVMKTPRRVTGAGTMPWGKCLCPNLWISRLNQRSTVKAPLWDQEMRWMVTLLGSGHPQ